MHVSCVTSAVCAYPLRMETVEQPYMTVNEVAALLRVTRATAYRWARRGDLPAVRVGGSLRVDRDALADRLKPTSHSVEPVSSRRVRRG